MLNGTVAISPFAAELKNKIIYLHKIFEKFTHFSNEGDKTH
jgi:hypothetical protein